MVNVSNFIATMGHIDMISCEFDDGSFNLADPRSIADETSQKYKIHLVESMEYDDHEDLMK